jgi:hypothetical protein
MKPLVPSMLLCLLFVVLALSGCEKRKQLIEEVGGAAHNEVDQAQVKINAAEKKLQANVNEADQIH